MSPMASWVGRVSIGVDDGDDGDDGDDERFDLFILSVEAGKG